MKTKHALLRITLGLLLLTVAGLSIPAQRASNTKTDTRILYHNGPVVTGTVAVYVIWYGCWRAGCGNTNYVNTQFVLMDFLSSLGSSPYFQINSTYPNSEGQAPSGAVALGSSAVPATYSHGNELTESDIEGIISDQVLSGDLPLDPSGLYLVVTSPDISAQSVGFCTAGEPPYHSFGEVLGTRFRYGFVGHAARCPSIAGPQFMASDGTILPTPNGDFAGDAMASDIAHVLSTMVTDPYGGAWYDKFGLENADKCQGKFGQIYVTSNGGRANLRLGYRDYLLQQNWVNDKKGRCALSQ